MPACGTMQLALYAIQVKLTVCPCGGTPGISVHSQMTIVTLVILSEPISGRLLTPRSQTLQVTDFGTSVHSQASARPKGQ